MIWAMDDETVRQLLDDVRAGRLDPDDAVARLRRLPVADLGFARVDTHRALRQGVPEVVMAEGKSPEQVAEIVTVLLEDDGAPVLVTRLDEGDAKAVLARCPDGEYLEEARLAVWRRVPATERSLRVAVVSAGTADGAVAEEAVEVARALGCTVSRINDVGVAGLHRVLAAAEQMEEADAIIVVAGMDGALPSVVGGLVQVPVVAVPTSTGYGAAFDGMAALLGMLASCAAGLTVVNIDNGFGAAMAAFRMARAARRMSSR